MTGRIQREFETRGARGSVGGGAAIRRSLALSLVLVVWTAAASLAQHGDKPRPEAWNGLVPGGRFMDRILPAPIYQGLETDSSNHTSDNLTS